MGGIFSRKTRFGEGIPGVCFDDEIKIRLGYELPNTKDAMDELIQAAEKEKLEEEEKYGMLKHVRPDTLTAVQLAQLESLRMGKATTPVEDEPYTFWERTGLVPIHVGRLRPRIFYYPITDFSKYAYDEISPEERELKARWIAKIYDFGMAMPMCVWSCVLTGSIALPNTPRWALMILGGYLGLFLEFCRVYTLALPERQDLDDFIVAKEVWYIKNVEARDFGLMNQDDDEEEEGAPPTDGNLFN
eukprot:PhM_4_TR14382/c0_g1_i1/m.54373